MIRSTVFFSWLLIVSHASTDASVLVQQSSGPTPAPTQNLWTCFENSGTLATLRPYTCVFNLTSFGVTGSGAKMDPSIDDLFGAFYFCNEPVDWRGPTRDNCRDGCYLQYTGPNTNDPNAACTNCMLVQDPDDPTRGTTAYDCRNLDDLIAAQNITTDCTAPHLSKKATSKKLDQHDDIEKPPEEKIVRRVTQIIEYEDGSEERRIMNDDSGFPQDQVTI